MSKLDKISPRSLEEKESEHWWETLDNGCGYGDGYAYREGSGEGIGSGYGMPSGFGSSWLPVIESFASCGENGDGIG